MKNLLIALVIIITFFWIVGKFSDSNTSTQDEDYLSYDGSNYEFIEVVKSGMNDPDSFEHVQTKSTENRNDIHLIMKFRGNNAFGAKVINYASADFDKSTRSISNLKTE